MSMIPDSIQVLVVEDDPGYARLIAEFLRYSESDPVNFQVSIVTQLSDALQKLSDKTINVTVIDLSLPDSFGLDTFRKIRAAAPDIALIILSGNSDDKLALRAMQEGAQDFISKARTDDYYLKRSIRYALERKQASVALAQSEQAYRALFENMPIGLYRTSAEGIIRDANPALAAMFGFQDRESLLEKNIAHFYVDPLDNEKFKHTMGSQNDLTNFVAEYRHQDGTTLLTEDHIHAVRNEAGEIIAYEGSLIDITERKLAEEKLRDSEEQLRQVWETTSDAMALSDANGAVLSANPAYYDLYGHTPGQIIGKNFAVIFSEDSQEQAREQYKTVFADNNIPPAFETVVQRADGTERIVESRISFLTSGGRRTAMLSTIRDITERKQAEEAKNQYTVELERRVQERTLELTHANRAKDEFLATMSHELRTPLNSILGFSESLLEQRRGPINEKQQQYVNLIHSSGQHLLDLINDILQVSKIEAGKLDIHPAAISIKEVCESSMNFVKEFAMKKSISLEFLDEESISIVYADPQRLKQILINLLNNAVKFTPENGRVSLEVRTNSEKDQIQFSITDTGIGIAPEYLQKLFTPFTQLDSNLSRQYQGTGLGLVLVYKLTELHGGSIQVESEPDKGSRFTVILPWSADENQDQRDDANSSVSIKAVRETASLSGEPSLILLAEDNDSNILAIQEYLMDHGYEVVIARNGLEALAKAEEFSPRIILMDIQMPEMDGLEAIRRLRTKPKFAPIPIIALTALAMPGDRERCLEAGANEYLSKPVSLKGLLKTVETFYNKNKQAK